MSSYVKTKFDYITLQVHNLSSSPSWKGKPSFQPSLPGGCSSLSYPKQEGVHQEVWCYFLQDKTVQMMGIYIYIQYINIYIYIHLYYVYKWIVYFPNKLGASCTPSHRWDKTEAILVCFWDSGNLRDSSTLPQVFPKNNFHTRNHEDPNMPQSNNQISTTHTCDFNNISTQRYHTEQHQELFCRPRPANGLQQGGTA